MTKREINAWLDMKEQDAYDKVCDASTKAKRDYRDQLSERLGVNEVAQKIFPLLDEATDILNYWKTKNIVSTEEKILPSNSYSNLTSRLYEITEDGLKGIIKYVECEFYISQDKDYDRIDAKFKDLKDQITANYMNLKANIRMAKNAQVALDYLKSLKIDVSELEKMSETPCTALSVEVNTKYLFI
jgi:hypothetical protein